MRVLFLCTVLISGIHAKIHDSVVTVAKPEQKLEEEFLDAVVETSSSSRKLSTLGVCQSDCDSDKDCDSGLVCWQRRTGSALPPCCSGSQPSDSRDFCVPSNCGSGGTGGGTGGGGDTSIDVGVILCFSGDTSVDVYGKGSLPMKELQVGDKVLSTTTAGNKLHYQPVYSFAHHQPETEATFLVLRTDDGEELEISGDHLIFLHDKANPVRASSVQPGDKLAPFGVAVTDIGTVTKTGIYAPLTPDATFLVNDGRVKVSSYAAIVQDTDAEYATLRNGRTKLISQHRGIHMLLAPYRIFCRATHSQSCDSYNEDGMPYHIASGIRLLKWANGLHPLFQAALFVVAFVVFGMFTLLEKALFSGPLVCVLIGLVSKLFLASRSSGKVKFA